MKILRILASGLTLFATILCAEASDYTAQYVDLGHQSAALYQPTSASENSKTGVIVMHSHQDYMNFIANSELTSRPTVVLLGHSGGATLMTALTMWHNGLPRHSSKTVLT